MEAERTFLFAARHLFDAGSASRAVVLLPDLHARVQALQLAHHTVRLRQVKPQVDAGAPRRSMGTNLKGARIEEERNAQIARENTILLGEKRPNWAEIGQWQSQRPLIRCMYSAGLIQTHTSRSNRRQIEQDFRT